MNIEYKTDFFNRLKKINKPNFMRRLVNRSGVIAEHFSKERFVNKDWLNGSSSKKWVPWSERTKKQRNGGGSLLIGKQSGRLKKSIRKLSQGDYFVYVGTDVPYAKIHNEGGEINKTVSVRTHNRKRNGRSQVVKSHRRKMKLKIPQRQFLGESTALVKRLERFANEEIKKEIQNL